jgi:hypothetical protein
VRGSGCFGFEFRDTHRAVVAVAGCMGSCLRS